MNKKLVKHTTRVHNAKDIGKILRQVRKNRNRTQETVAGLSNLGNRFIVDLEAGKPTIQMDKTIQALHINGIAINLEYSTMEDINEWRISSIFIW